MQPEGKFLEPSDQLRRGADVIDAISAAEGWERIKLPTQIKLLGSLISSEPIATNTRLLTDAGKNFHHTVAGTNGLFIQNKLYPYTAQYQNYFHKEILTSIAANAKIPKDMLDSLITIHKLWNDAYISCSIERHKEAIHAEYNKKIERVRTSIKKNFRGNSLKKHSILSLDSIYPQLTEEQRKIITGILKDHDKTLLHIKKVKHNDEIKIELERMRLMEELTAEKNKLIQTIKNPTHRDRERIRKQLTQEVNNKIGQLKDEMKERYEQMELNAQEQINSTIKNVAGIDFDYSIYVELLKCKYNRDFENYVINEGHLTQTELQEYHEFSVLQQRLPGEILKCIKDNENHLGQIIKFTRAFDKNLYKKRRHDPSIYETRRESETKRMRYGNRVRLDFLLTMIKQVQKRDCGEQYYKNFNRAKHLRLTESKFKTKASFTEEQAKEMFTSTCEALLPHESEKINQWYDKFKEANEKYYSYLMVKYQEALIAWGSWNGNARNSYQVAVKAAEEECAEMQLLRAPIRAKNEIEEIFRKIFQILSQDEEINPTGLIMIPSGILIITQDKRVMTYGIHPLDTRIEAVLSREQWKDWQGTWLTFLKNEVSLFDDVIRKSIVKLITEFMRDNSSCLEPHERRLKQLLAAHDVEQPLLINLKTGVINPPINEDHAAILEQVLPSCGEYVSRITTEAGTKKNINDVTGAIKNFVAGVTTGRTGLVMSHNNKIELNMAVVESLLIETDNNFDKIINLILTSAGIALYGLMTPAISGEFNQIVKDRLNISKMELYQLSGRRIDSVIERRQLTSRIIFVHEFIKAARKTASEQISQFFLKLNQQYKNNE